MDGLLQQQYQHPGGMPQGQPQYMAQPGMQPQYMGQPQMHQQVPQSQFGGQPQYQQPPPQHPPQHHAPHSHEHGAVRNFTSFRIFSYTSL